MSDLINLIACNNQHNRQWDSPREWWETRWRHRQKPLQIKQLNIPRAFFLSVAALNKFLLAKVRGQPPATVPSRLRRWVSNAIQKCPLPSDYGAFIMSLWPQQSEDWVPWMLWNASLQLLYSTKRAGKTIPGNSIHTCPLIFTSQSRACVRRVLICMVCFFEGWKRMKKESISPRVNRSELSWFIVVFNEGQAGIFVIFGKKRKTKHYIN